MGDRSQPILSRTTTLGVATQARSGGRKTSSSSCTSPGPGPPLGEFWSCAPTMSGPLSVGVPWSCSCVSGSSKHPPGQALNYLNGREEREQQYTVFSDSKAAIARAQHDRTGPAQALAKAAISVVDSITGRGNTVTPRWTQSMQEPGGTSGLTGWPRERQRGGRGDLSQHTCWRQASPTSPERLPRQGRRPQQSGSETTPAEDVDTAPPRVEG